jgi:LytS/YehU family sensor histidine kinase
MLGKLRLHHDLSVQEALRHYFNRHTQVSLLTYWIIVGTVQLYRMRDEAHRRELRSSKLEAELSAAQLEVLRAQIHPHFLFNTLQAATTLIHEDPDGAEDILLRLSELLRVSVDETNIQEIPLNRELEVLDLYIGIQSRRFGDRLRFEVSIEQNVRDCMVPVLILQPLIENAIRHGIARHKGSDTVSIHGFQKSEFLRLEVRNLNSCLEDKPARSLGPGVGLANTRARLEQLYGNQQEFRIRNLEPTGVSAELSIPLRSAPVLVEEPPR